MVNQEEKNPNQPSIQETPTIEVSIDECKSPPAESFGERSVLQHASDHKEFLMSKQLTTEETHERLELERKVEFSVYEAGKALRELRDRRLYRSTHDTFEHYCRDRFNMRRAHPYRLILAASVYENLLEAAETKDAILPTNECQLRPLTRLPPEKQADAWRSAVDQGRGKVPTGKIVAMVVERVLERKQSKDLFHANAAVKIITNDHIHYKNLSGVWGIIQKVYEKTADVMLCSGIKNVSLELLQEIKLSSDDLDKLHKTISRVNRIYRQPNLEKTALLILNNLMRQAKQGLSEFEEKLLQFLEAEHGERRRDPRVLANFPVEIVSEAENKPIYQSACINLSANGIYISKIGGAHFEGEIELRLFLEPNSDGVKCSAQVVREDENGFGCKILHADSIDKMLSAISLYSKNVVSHLH